MECKKLQASFVLYASYSEQSSLQKNYHPQLNEVSSSVSIHFTKNPVLRFRLVWLDSFYCSPPASVSVVWRWQATSMPDSILNRFQESILLSLYFQYLTQLPRSVVYSLQWQNFTVIKLFIFSCKFIILHCSFRGRLWTLSFHLSILYFFHNYSEFTTK